MLVATPFRRFDGKAQDMMANDRGDATFLLFSHILIHTDHLGHAHTEASLILLETLPELTIIFRKSCTPLVHPLTTRAKQT